MADYNDRGTSIRVDPPQLFDTGQEMKTHGTAIVDGVNRITAVWRDLRLGWSGETASDAEAFLQRWNTTATAFFGEEEKDEGGDGLGKVKPGVLGKVVLAVQMAADNFGQAEDFATGLFNDMADSLSGSSSDTDPDTARNITEPPITESNA